VGETYARILGPADLIARLSSPKELSVIKGSQPTRKGCAFLKYDTKEQAMCAIEALNGVYRMEGSPSALVVKWVDTKKEREIQRWAGIC
jgi:CUG-BP- and ETR3-like factor